MGKRLDRFADWLFEYLDSVRDWYSTLPKGGRFMWEKLFMWLLLPIWIGPFIMLAVLLLIPCVYIDFVRYVEKQWEEFK